MPARMTNPAVVLPDAAIGIQQLTTAMFNAGVPRRTLQLIHLRASQINGCSACVGGGVENARKAGVPDEQLHTLAAWRETPYFTDTERAAVELTEAVTRLADRPDPVPDEIWTAVTDFYDETELSAIILMIATTNFFNRINRTIKEPAGTRWNEHDSRSA